MERISSFGGIFIIFGNIQVFFFYTWPARPILGTASQLSQLLAMQFNLRVAGDDDDDEL